MRSTELRVGNWVNINGWAAEVAEISANHIDVFNDIEPYSLKEVEPIPLTEEWLVRFGFNKVSHIWEFWKNSDWNLKQHKLENKWWLYCCGEEVDCIRIDYVHQLQNLYHALTGEELELKL